MTSSLASLDKGHEFPPIAFDLTMGWVAGYVYLADTLIAYKMIGLRRGGVIVAALAMFGVVLVGGSVLVQTIYLTVLWTLNLPIDSE